MTVERPNTHAGMGEKRGEAPTLGEFNRGRPSFPNFRPRGSPMVPRKGEGRDILPGL
jgi:hypothetical protein